MTASRVTIDIREDLRGKLTETAVASLHEAEPRRWLTRSRTTDTSVVEVPNLGPAVRKRWRWPGFKERLRGLGRTTALARTPAEREWTALARVYGSQQQPLRFHPRPIALRIERVGGFAVGAMLLLELLPRAIELHEFLDRERSPAKRRAVLLDLATRVRAMHSGGVSDGDLHPRNLLVTTEDLRVWKVDCARQRLHRPPLTGRRAVYDLACVDVGLVRYATRTERVRTLREYVQPLAGTDSDAVRRLAASVSALRLRIDADESRRLPRASRAR